MVSSLYDSLPQTVEVFMSNLYWLSEDQMGRLRPYFPMSRGRARVDDRGVLSGITSLIVTGCVGVTLPKNAVRTILSGITSLIVTGCVGVTLPKNAVRTRLYTTAGNGGVIWGYLGRSWRGSQPKRLTTRRSQSTQLTSRNIARLPA